MRRRTSLAVILILALALAACVPAPTATGELTGTVSVPVTGDTETPEAIMTDTPVETAAAGPPTVDPSVASPTTDAAGAGVTISASTGANVSEPFLVDQQGRTLYLFISDTQNAGTSTCTADCLAQWPPILVTGMPQAGAGVDAALLSTITRDDGTLQATYNGWPLYYYAGDLAPGDMSGQGMGSVWFLVSGTGNAIQQ